MKIAAVQHDIVWCDRPANVERLASHVASAAGVGAGLVLLTETFSTGFATDRPDLGEPAEGPSATFLHDQAVRHGVWLGGTFAESPPPGSEDPRPANTFLLVAPDGTAHRYRKRHTFGFGGEDRYLRAGEDLVTVDVDGLRVTMFVCYDLRFAPEFWATAPDTDCYLVPANWPASRRVHWSTLLRARAIENQAWVVGVNRVGRGGPIDYAGDSVVIDPLGEVVASADEAVEQIILADVTAERVADVRTELPFLGDR